MHEFCVSYRWKLFASPSLMPLAEPRTNKPRMRILP
jgi:hypothetical protein